MRRAFSCLLTLATAGCAGLVGADFDSLHHREETGEAGGATSAGGASGTGGTSSSQGGAGSSGAAGSSGFATAGGGSGGAGGGSSGQGNGGGHAGSGGGGAGSGGIGGSGGISGNGGGAPVPPLVCGDMSGLQAASPWPMGRYCPTRQGRSPAPRLTAPQPMWVVPTSSEVTTEPAIAADGTIYVGTQDGHLVAVSGGTIAWSTALGSGPINAAPAIGADGTIYLGSGTDEYAVSPAGAVIWHFPTMGVIQSAVAIGKDRTIYFGSGDYSLYALAPDGSMRWSLATGNVIWTSPAIAPDGTIYVTSYDKKLHAISQAGVEQWTFPAGDYIASSPTVGDDGTVYFASYDKNAYAVTPAGKSSWTFPTGQVVTADLAYYDGLAFVTNADETLFAVGKGAVLAWQAPLVYPLGAPSLTFDGALVFSQGSFSAPLVVSLDSGGNKLWSVDVKTTFVARPPAAALGKDGSVYVGFGSSLYAFGP